MPRRKKVVTRKARAHTGRDPATVRNVMLRMSDLYVDALDDLCKINQRSRREIVEILVHEASAELEKDRNARINPL